MDLIRLYLYDRPALDTYYLKHVYFRLTNEAVLTVAALVTTSLCQRRLVTFKEDRCSNLSSSSLSNYIYY